MKAPGTFLLALLLGSSAAAQTREVRELVRAIERHYQTVRTARAIFLERYSEGADTLRVESGTVYFSRPGRMRWEYEAPEEKLFLVDGKQVWFYVPADRTVTRAELDESAQWQTPLALLTRRPEFSRFCGRLELVPADSADPGVRPSETGNPVLRCLPRGNEPAFREVLLEVNRMHQIVRALVREPAGIETEFRFARWEENLPLREVLFHLDVPPGVAIVEQSEVAGPIRE
ncbi:MAG: outer membrane lipoprotein carrier protein LolA [Firmicutes bacterium]|nr:outer membrane lipoprotein carrier protein LolA [Bacillota bacterium]